MKGDQKRRDFSFVLRFFFLRLLLLLFISFNPCSSVCHVLFFLEENTWQNSHFEATQPTTTAAASKASVWNSLWLELKLKPQGFIIVLNSFECVCVGELCELNFRVKQQKKRAIRGKSSTLNEQYSYTHKQSEKTPPGEISIRAKERTNEEETKTFLQA